MIYFEMLSSVYIKESRSCLSFLIKHNTGWCPSPAAPTHTHISYSEVCSVSFLFPKGLPLNLYQIPKLCWFQPPGKESLPLLFSLLLQNTLRGGWKNILKSVRLKQVPSRRHPKCFNNCQPPKDMKYCWEARGHCCRVLCEQWGANSRERRYWGTSFNYQT